ASHVFPQYVAVLLLVAATANAGLVGVGHGGFGYGGFGHGGFGYGGFGHGGYGGHVVAAPVAKVAVAAPLRVTSAVTTRHD
ncbi:secreted protein, putative, partial [Ixodes scapularis]